MGASRPAPPKNEAATTLPHVDDQLIDRHLQNLNERVRALEVAPMSPTQDGRRGFVMGGDKPGDVYYRGANGKLIRLPPGTVGQRLTIGPDGLPRWS